MPSATKRVSTRRKAPTAELHAVAAPKPAGPELVTAPAPAAEPPAAAPEAETKPAPYKRVYDFNGPEDPNRQRLLNEITDDWEFGLLEALHVVFLDLKASRVYSEDQYSSTPEMFLADVLCMAASHIAGGFNITFAELQEQLDGCRKNFRNIIETAGSVQSRWPGLVAHFPAAAPVERITPPLPKMAAARQLLEVSEVAAGTDPVPIGE